MLAHRGPAGALSRGSEPRNRAAFRRLQHEPERGPQVIEPEWREAEGNAMPSGRNFDPTEQDVGAQDRGADAVDFGNPAGVPDVVQDKHAARFTVGFGFDFDPIRAPQDNAGAAGACAGDGGRLLASPSPDRVLIDADTPPARRYDLAAAGASGGRARIVLWRPDRVEVEADSEAGGMLALHDVWYPGWIAEIDGIRAPILRADVLFRGVEIPSGRHRVVFRFAPFGLDNLHAALKLVLQSQEGRTISRL